MLSFIRKLWWREKKITWTMRVTQFFSRSRTLALVGGIVALLGGARAVRRKTSHAS